METQTQQSSGRIIGGGRPYTDNPGPGPVIMSADSLQGDDVVNAEGENLGKIVHIMLDVPTGRIAYAVLSFGGFLGMGDKLFAIPWEALVLNADDENFVLNVDKERLKDAPGFDKDHWPEMADPQWGANVYAHYGYRPYWDINS